MEPTSSFTTRALSASRMKNELANVDPALAVGKDYDLSTVNIVENGKVVEYYPFVFSKTLPHDDVTGFVKKIDADALLLTVKDGSASNRNLVPQHPSNNRQLVSVNDGFSHTLMAGDPRSKTITKKYLQTSSKSNMFEMMEVYENALLRDTTFADIDAGTDAGVVRALATLNSYGAAITGPMADGTITGKTLFRGLGVDETVGPYISQFLYKGYNYGNIPVVQKYEPESDAANSVAKQGWLDIQNGITGSTPAKTTAKFCNTPRVLGAKVHNDPLYQFYYAAALIAFQNGIKPDGWQTPDSRFEAFATTGPPDILASVAAVAGIALRSAFNVKWAHAMKIRPEVLAQRIDSIDRGEYDSLDFPNLSALKTNIELGRATLTAVSADNMALDANALVDGKFLKLQFTEGSPVHPAWPAGHAVVAGASTTVLKAMVKTHDSAGARVKWISGARTELVHSIDGDALVAYDGADKMDCTVIGELNKLASNVAIGRDFAGVHYRCDGDCGVALGEEIAIDYLVDKASEYFESRVGIFNGWTLEKFDGTTIRITQNGVETI